MKRLKFPSKTFLLGEYAILSGCPALLLTHAPFFEVTLGDWPEVHSFHPESPAGKWVKENPIDRTVSFHDPHGGAGGYGASGAEFLAAWFAPRKVPESEDERAAVAWGAWEDSRAFPGSGADVLVQAYGVNLEEPSLLAVDLNERTLERLPPKLGCTLSLFHTGKKAETHKQLDSLPPLPMGDLYRLVLEGTKALTNGDADAFAQSLNDYGAALDKVGLLAPHSKEALSALPKEGVLAAKGCGAMGSDVLLVLHRNAALGDWARANSLAETVALPV